MIVVMIEGFTRVLGKSQGYFGLPLRDEVQDGVPCMMTAWEPTPDELVAINAGAKIEISIMGKSHPPIFVGVGNH